PSIPVKGLGKCFSWFSTGETSMLDEVRYAVRSWLASPGFTFVAVVTLALGIGASTAIFSVVDAVLLKPLPFKNSDRLVMLLEQTLRDGESRPTSSQRISCCRNNPINFIAWRDQNQSFEQMAAFMQVLVNLIGDGEPEQVPALVVVNPFFEVLGIQPVLGRTFRPEEDTPGNNNGGIVSDELWQRRWGGNPDVVGRKLTMNNRLVEVVGVMPPGFRFPNTGADLWVPLGMDRGTTRGTVARRGPARARSGRHGPRRRRASHSASGVQRQVGRRSRQPARASGGCIQDRPLGSVRSGWLRPDDCVRQRGEPDVDPFDAARAGPGGTHSARCRARPPGPAAPRRESDAVGRRRCVRYSGRHLGHTSSCGDDSRRPDDLQRDRDRHRLGGAALHVGHDDFNGH